MQELNVPDLIQILPTVQRVALFLGAGASVTSGIPTAPQLTSRWQKELYERDQARGVIDPFDTWLAKHEERYLSWLHENHPAASPESKQYSYTFERVAPTRAQRQHCIADLCDAAKPRTGYYALAALQTQSKFDTVLTTNFDDLLLEATFDIGATRPQVSAHTETVQMIRLSTPRPKIIKLHGDFLFDDLQNTDSETQALRRAMADVLRLVNQEFALLVIGYGGNDDSIMSVLESLDRGNPQGIFWCIHATGDLSHRARALLDGLPDTFLIRIDGFDELMASFFRNFVADPQEVYQRSIERGRRIRKSLLPLGGSAPVPEALAETDHAIEVLQLIAEAARQASDGDLIPALVAIVKALEIDPNQQTGHALLGMIYYQLGDLTLSEAAVRRAIELDPSSMSYNLLAVVIWAQGRLDEAEQAARQASEIDPDAAGPINSLAIIFRDLGRLDEADAAITRLMEIDSHDPGTLLNAASIDIARGRPDEAPPKYRLAIERLLAADRASRLPLHLAVAYVGLGNLDEALSRFRAWSSRYERPVRPDAIRYLLSLARAHHEPARQVLHLLRTQQLLPQDISVDWAE